jgi:RNA polymerase sigma-70 factor, ECF subfamily
VTPAEVETAIARVKDGELEAYDVVVRAFQSRLRALLAYASPAGVDADELAHRVFVEAYLNIDRYVAGTSFFAWLSGIGRVLLLGELRRMRNDARKHENYLHKVMIVAMDDEIGSHEQLQESHVQHLRDCVAKLPDELRELVRLRYESQTPVNMIAEALGKTANAVKVRLFSIRKRLRSCVESKLAIGEGAP